MRRLQIMTRTNRQLRPWHAPYVYGSFWRTARKNALGERPPVSSECPSCPLISKLNEVNILTCWYHWKYYQYLLFVEFHELKLNESFKLSLSGAPAHLNIRHNVRLSTLVNSSNCGKAAAALTCTKFETNYWQNYSMNENICIDEKGEWKTFFFSKKFRNDSSSAIWCAIHSRSVNYLNTLFEPLVCAELRGSMWWRRDSAGQQAVLSGPCVFVRVHQKRTVGLRDLLRPFQVRSSCKATRSRSASPPQIRRPMAAVPLRFPSRFLGLEKQRPSSLSFSAFGPKKKITELRLVQREKKKKRRRNSWKNRKSYIFEGTPAWNHRFADMLPADNSPVYFCCVHFFFSCSGRDSWQVACDPTG